MGKSRNNKNKYKTQLSADKKSDLTQNKNAEVSTGNKSSVPTGFGEMTLDQKIDELFKLNLHMMHQIGDINKKLHSLSDLESNVNQINEKIVDLSLENKGLARKLVQLEKLSNFNSLEIYGLEIDCSNDPTQQAINFFREYLGIENVNISRIHVSQLINKPSRIKITLVDSSQFKLIFNNCHKLKGKEIYVNKVYDSLTNKERFELRKFRKGLSKDQQRECKIKGNILQNGNIRYKFDHEKNEVVVIEETLQKENVANT